VVAHQGRSWLSDKDGKKNIKNQINKATEGTLGGFVYLVETYDDCPPLAWLPASARLPCLFPPLVKPLAARARLPCLATSKTTALQDKYNNPFTDFGFKKMFGSDLLDNFDKWLFVLQQLPYLQNRPQALQDRIFQKLFEAAEIAKFTPDEKNKYEERLKYYRDLKNVVDTSFDEGSWLVWRWLVKGAHHQKRNGRVKKPT